MVVILLTSCHVADFERVERGCFLDILLNPSHLCLSVKIISFLFIRNGFSNRPARAKKNMNTQSILNLLHIVCITKSQTLQKCLIIKVTKMSNNKSYD